MFCNPSLFRTKMQTGIIYTHLVLAWRFCYFIFSPTNWLSTSLKSQKVGQSDTAVRPRFQNGGDVFLTLSSTPETPASWPPRPELTGLSLTLVAGHSCPILIHFWFPFLFVMAVLNNFQTIPSPSPLFLPLRPRPEAIRSGFENYTTKIII